MSPVVPALGALSLAAALVCLAATAPAGAATTGLRRLPTVAIGRPVDMKPPGGGRLTMNVVRVDPAAQAVRGARPGDVTVAVYLTLVTSAGSSGRPTAKVVLQSAEAHGVLAVSGSNRVVYQPGAAVVANCTRLGAGIPLGRRQWSAAGCYTFEVPADVTPSTVLFTPARISGSPLASWKTN